MLNDQHVVVLGGSAGIGLAVALAAARAGARVAIASHDRTRVDLAVAQLASAAPSAPIATGHTIDLRDEHAAASLFAKLATSGPIDHLVYTAGEELLLSPLADLDLAAARRFFDLRYWGALTAVRAARPHFTRTGSIVLTSGSAGHRPHPGFVIGASICSAIEATARTLAVELAPVRVNVVTPGFVDTGLWGNIPEAPRAEMFRAVAAKLPVGRIGTPADIAEHYLGFMRGSYVTGQHLIVDGGGVLV
jgi:NAD(P)-dependent dehydrogenase (short-subunit alcohol dehydrogenase family)